MANILISLITITSNNPDLKNTLDSIKNQTYTNFEHIIIDNLSTDNTPKIVEKYRQSVKYKVIYIRESDTGRYNAMNKGIKTATGEYLLFLNAGDSLLDNNVLKKVTPQLDKDIVYGDIEGKSLSEYPVNKQFFKDRTIFHQAAFIKKELFDKYGLYDENYQISADFEFFIRTIIKYRATTKYIPQVIAKYDTHGISSSQSDLVYSERAKALMTHYSGLDFIYNYLKYIYYKYKKYLPSFLISFQQKRLNSKPQI